MSASLETVDSGHSYINSYTGRFPTATGQNKYNSQTGSIPVTAAYNSYSGETSSGNNPLVGRTIPRENQKFESGFSEMTLPLNVVPDVDDEMMSYERRLESFRQWPENFPIMPEVFATAGFYYTGYGDQVRCFSCDLQLRQWAEGDDPLLEHKKNRPTCRFLLESERENYNRVTCQPMEATSENQRAVQGNFQSVTQENRKTPRAFPALPIGAVPEVSQHLQSLTNQGYAEGNTFQINPYQSINIQSGGGREPYIFVRSEEDRPSLSQEESYRSTAQSQMPYVPQMQVPMTVYQPGNQNFPVYQETPRASQPYTYSPYSGFPQYYQEMSMQGNYLGRMVRPQGRPPLPNPHLPTRVPGSIMPQQNPNNPAMSTVNSQHELAGRVSKQIPGNRQIPEEEPRRRAHVPNLRIPVVRPLSRQPEGPLVRTEDARHVTSPTDLESEHHRLTTFVDWPESSPVKPWELSSAGFYYLGNKDSVKCYRCGVALRNWEPDDTPWEEHEKWSPQCPLVIEHHRTRTQVRPVETEEPARRQEPQVFQESQVFRPGNARYQQRPGGADIGRRSPPSARVPEVSSPNQERAPVEVIEMSHTQGPVPSSSPGINYGHEHHTYSPQKTSQSPWQGSQSPQQGSQSPQQVSQANPLPTKGIKPHIQSPMDSERDLSFPDLNTVYEMGFTQQDIDAAYARKLSRSGTGFVSLDKLMQALLESNEEQGEIQSPCSPQPGNDYRIMVPRGEPQCNEQMPAVRSKQRPVSSRNLSLPMTTEKQVLRRTNSAPPESTEMPLDESLQQKLERMQEERMCKICMDAEVGIVFLPCGHLSCCPECAKDMEFCPMCRAPIHETIRTFLS